MAFSDFDDMLHRETQLENETKLKKSYRKTVLVVDDDSNILASLQLVLQEHFNSVLCNSGDEGIKVFNESIYAVILDIKMAEKDGFETYMELKKENPFIPIIFYSAYQDLINPYKLINEYRPFAYISKGTGHEKLLHTVFSAVEYYDAIQSKKILLEELQVLNESLEQKVIERTKQLDKALKKQKELHDLKSSFLSMISHEVRTPLTSIVFSTELLELNYDRLTQDKRKRCFRNIRDSIADLNSLVEGILFIDHSERNPPMELVEINLYSYLENVIEQFRNLSNDRIKVSYHIKADKSYLLDRKLLRNIYYNLISNAIKYSPDNKEILIEIKEVANELEFKIQDFGIGVPAEEIDSLFSLFYRAKNIGRIQGIGLGLNIVKRSVDALGGSIQVKSENGKGSIFTVWIPLDQKIELNSIEPS
ncbi:MAG: hybrid sensor histidine kinase/response regulator [Leptospiraceae bacterium]|nr:hybrid sensor histidine kinase/response regulator [Leptospiraceae bacterium]MCP5496694.1 hybrid sensor histidine kinase/response regulator [Leptospiraceae bacterium]